ncbi:hypothetical protein [Agarivorans sp. DSG3-1]|uniref:hypothetical protein n=1 Tax=Agarivorans sp. DSG3-1 TaxID=3342249 RepID=UPI00398EB8ED
MTKSYETVYNHHIQLARKAARGQTGYERARVIWQYFETTEHPHPSHTFRQMAINRTSDNQFPTDLLQAMAHLCAINEAYPSRVQD